MDVQAGGTLLVWGQVTLVVCFALYLLWWWVFFWPREDQLSRGLRLLGVASIVVAAICGIAGIGLSVAGITALAPQGCIVEPWQLAIGGMVAYVALFFVTSVLLDRPPTSELLIITAWATLELAVAVVLPAAGVAPMPTLVVLVATLAVFVALSLFCYLRFYKLEGRASFVCGAAPLVCAIVFCVVATVVTALALG